eukprot:sb/3472791/
MNFLQMPAQIRCPQLSRLILCPNPTSSCLPIPLIAWHIKILQFCDVITSGQFADVIRGGPRLEVYLGGICLVQPSFPFYLNKTRRELPFILFLQIYLYIMCTAGGTGTDTSKQPIRTRYLGHVTGYQRIRDQYFLIRSVPVGAATIIQGTISRAYHIIFGS